MVQDANKPPLNQIDVTADPVAAIDVMIDALRSMPSHPDLHILNGGTDIEIVKSAYAKCKDMYSGKEPKAIKVLSDGEVIYVGWQGMKHALSDKGNVVKALASTCIEDLIQKSYFVEVMANKHGETKPDIKETLLYQSKMLLDKVPVDIGIVVRVFKDGRKMYDYFVANKNPVSISDGNKSDQPLTGSLSNISTLSEIVKGRSSIVKTPKGTKLDTVFALVEAYNVIASHDSTGGTNPKFPQELQPRDRSREASQAWVQKTAANLDPDSLGKTSRADTGAPIVGDDLIVESGNGRTMAIQLAYARGTAEEYRTWLVEEAEYFGFKPEQVEAFKQPVLVRIRKTDIDRAAFAVEANQDDKLSLSATERAKADARRIDDNMAMLFNPSEDGDLLAAGNTKFIQAFLQSIGDTEAAQYIGTDGKPTQALVLRIKAAVFSKAYRDDRLLEMVADQTKPDLKNMLNALSVAAPKFIEAQAISRLQTEDLSSQIVDGIESATDQKVIDAIIAAANVVMTAKNDNQDVTEFVKQQGLFGDLPDGVPELAVFLSKNAGSAKKMSLLFKAMASFLEKQAIDQSNNSLFGDPEPLSMREVIQHAAGVLEQEYGDKANLSMFDALFTEAEILRYYYLHSDIDKLAHEAATSPYNDLPEPTDEQKNSGDYVKGKLSIAGVDIAIENPAGSTRSGVDANGKAWQSTMKHHYGYIENTMGADGDELDVFVKTGLTEFNNVLYVIRQLDPTSLDFDEHKIVIGAATQEEAKQIYLSNYEPDWQGMGSIETLSIEDFRNRLGKTWTQFDSIGQHVEPITVLDQLIGILQAKKITDQQQLMELREEIRTKDQTARYLMGGRKGLWGRTTNADNKRSAELSNLRLKYQLALNHFIALYSIEEREAQSFDLRHGINSFDSIENDQVHPVFHAIYGHGNHWNSA